MLNKFFLNVHVFLGRNSSVGRTSDQNVRRYTDTGSIFLCGKEFSSKSQLSVQTLFTALRSKSQTLEAIGLLLFGNTKILHAVFWAFIKNP